MQKMIGTILKDEILHSLSLWGDLIKNRLEAPAILPFCSGGSVYYLHEQVLWALEGLIREQKLPRPFFTQRCALVYLHHYRVQEGVIHHCRDYDNVEHRCVTNALAALAMWGDSPHCIISWRRESGILPRSV